ncbi:MAG: DNA polymerase III subunit delta [Papillibacter sp.]|nr:DNA polymerase III subunit delta [Papillibacter sp.]
MSELSLNELKKQIKTGNIASFYILYGNETYLKENYLAELRKAVLGPESDDFNLRRFDGRELELDELIEAVEAYPSFAEKTFVEVRDFDIFKCNEGDSERLRDLLNDLPDYCCLTLVYDAVEYKPDKRKKLYSLIEAKALTVDIHQQEQNDIIKWIYKHFEAYGKTISYEDAAYLIFLCGSLMNGLNNEINKIAVYAKGNRVTRADIDAAATPVVEAVIFDLTNYISAKNYEKAAETMGKLFQLSESLIGMLSVIGSQIRRLYSARLIRDSGGGEKDIMELLQLRSAYQAKLLYKGCMNFSYDWYKNILQLCAETDLKMKSSSGESEELLITLFINMASRK